MHDNSIINETFNLDDIDSLFKDTFNFLDIKPEWLGFDILDSLVFSANNIISQCDIAGCNFDKLTDLLLDEKKAFILSINQAGMQHILECIPECSTWSEFQKGYTENFMTGVAATVHNIDLSQLDFSVDMEHIEELKAMHEGKEFAIDFIDQYGSTPSFEDCKKYLEDTSHHNNISFKGYTQSYINNKYHKAEMEYSHAKANYQRHMDLAKTGTMPNNDELAHAREAYRHMEAAKAEMSKWKYTHPDKK